MTNAEKYLKDEVSIRKFREELAQFIFDELGFYDGTEETINEVIGDFLYTIEKPQLTEDERVILRNIHIGVFDKIGRAKNGNLFLTYEDDRDTEDFWWCDHLFQFIKEGEEYEIEELLKNE